MTYLVKPEAIIGCVVLRHSLWNIECEHLKFSAAESLAAVIIVDLLYLQSVEERDVCRIAVVIAVIVRGTVLECFDGSQRREVVYRHTVDSSVVSLRRLHIDIYSRIEHISAACTVH